MARSALVLAAGLMGCEPVVVNLVSVETGEQIQLDGSNCDLLLHAAFNHTAVRRAISGACDDVELVPANETDLFFVDGVIASSVDCDVHDASSQGFGFVTPYDSDGESMACTTHFNPEHRQIETACFEVID